MSLRMKSPLKEEISTKRPQNVEKMHPKRKMSMKWPQNMEKIQPKRKMSRKAPKNRDKPQPQGAEGAQMQQKTPSQSRDGVFYLNGSDELTAEVVEQDVL